MLIWCLLKTVRSVKDMKYPEWFCAVLVVMYTWELVHSFSLFSYSLNSPR